MEFWTLVFSALMIRSCIAQNFTNINDGNLSGNAPGCNFNKSVLAEKISGELHKSIQRLILGRKKRTMTEESLEKSLTNMNKKAGHALQSIGGDISEIVLKTNGSAIVSANSHNVPGDVVQSVNVVQNDVSVASATSTSTRMNKSRIKRSNDGDMMKDIIFRITIEALENVNCV